MNCRTRQGKIEKRQHGQARKEMLHHAFCQIKTQSPHVYTANMFMVLKLPLQPTADVEGLTLQTHLG